METYTVEQGRGDEDQFVVPEDHTKDYHIFAVYLPNTDSSKLQLMMKTHNFSDTKYHDFHKIEFELGKAKFNIFDLNYKWTEEFKDEYQIVLEESWYKIKNRYYE